MQSGLVVNEQKKSRQCSKTYTSNFSWIIPKADMQDSLDELYTTSSYTP